MIRRQVGPVRDRRRCLEIVLTVWAMVVLGVLSGCTFEAKTQFEADGSGLFSWGFGLTPEDLSALDAGEAGPTAEGLCESLRLGEGLPPGASLRQEERDGALWCVASFRFRDTNELRRFYQQEIEGLTVEQLEIRDGRLLYAVTLDLQGTAGDPSGLIEESGFEFLWQLEPPGPAESHNADEVDGRVLTWRLSPGETHNLKAVAVLSAGPAALARWPVFYVVLALAVMLGAGAASLLLLLRRRGS